MRRGIECLGEMGKLLGKDNIIYRYAINGINGINEKMNTDIELCFSDEYVFECFVAEAIIQNLKAGAYIDITDIKNSFKNEHFSKNVCDYAEEHNIR